MLFSGRHEECVAFYRAIGVPLQEERHGADGPLHHACDLHGVHIAVFAAQGQGEALGIGQPGGSFAGFAVESVEAAVEAAVGVGATVIQQPDDYPWGRRAVLRDPDGRPVEVFAPPT